MDESNSRSRCQNKLFITNIPKKVNKYAMYELLIQTSKISEFHYDQEKGYCFASYETLEDLEYTCNVLRGVKLYGKRIYFNRVEKRAKILVRNIGNDIDDVFLWDVFGKFGSCHIEFREESACIIVYKRREYALKAMETVNGKVIGNSNVSVEMCDPD